LFLIQLALDWLVVGVSFIFLILAQIRWDLQTQIFHHYNSGFWMFWLWFSFFLLCSLFPFCVYYFLFSFVMFVVLLCVLDQRLCGNFRSSWFGFINPFGLVLLTHKGLVV
jgi:hypothetical protein